MIGIEGESGFQRVDGTPVPDAALSTTSTNSVQNKVVTENINQINSNLSDMQSPTQIEATITIGQAASIGWVDFQPKLSAQPSSVVLTALSPLGVSQIQGLSIAAGGYSRNGAWFDLGNYWSSCKDYATVANVSISY